MKKNIHVISHTHWDREWYMPFEYHRAKLIELIDRCLWLFENDENFHSFYLDGHTIGIEDYLEIKPQNRDKLKKYITEGKLVIGPWYVLQDEFLTSSESNIRNILTGMKMAKEFGKVSTLGYFPDSFGNVGQMPQLLKQAGMKAIAFGRGVKPTGMNNTVSDFDGYESQFSEMYWQSPDKSKLPAILFANWYNNGAEMPVDENSEYWDKRISDVLKYAATDEMLLMNGSDHMPVQMDLIKAINTAQKMYPEYNFIHSDFEKYVDALTVSLPDGLVVIEGELTNQDTDGWWSLVNTSSSHIYLKQMNRKCEILLESVTEPICTIASLLGKEYPHDMLAYAWKTLMKNHPHDSICGCSVDAVNDEMRIRFIKSRQVTETILQDNLEYISEYIDIVNFEKCDVIFSVINTYSRKKSSVVSIDLDLSRTYNTENLSEAAMRFNSNTNFENYILIDENGSEIPCTIEYMGAKFGYELPKDCFRKPYIAERIKVTFEAANVSGIGYQVYGLKISNTTCKNAGLITAKNTMENDYIKVKINADGTVNIIEKSTDKEFKNLLKYEDVADIGNEYTFIPVTGDIPIFSGKEPTDIEIVCNEAYKATYKIKTEMLIPESADEKHKKEQLNFVHFTKRQAKRSEKTLTVPIYTYVTLEKNGRGIKVKTEFTNTAKDHRLRVILPTALKNTTHKVESVFEAVTRNNTHKPCWTYPSGCEHQQGFVMMKDTNIGILVNNVGLYEYEIQKDNSIALTLVRAVGELGDWGVFQTELSQCQRKLSLEYEIVPFTDENDAFDVAAAYQYPMQSVQILKNQSNNYKNDEIHWHGDALRMTALKNAQDKDDIIMRWVNYSQMEETLILKKTKWINNIYRSNIIEEKIETLKDNDGEWKIKVEPFEIVTLGVEK